MDNSETLRKFVSMSDDELRELVYKIGTASGINPEKLAVAGADPARMRRFLSSLSGDDITQIINSVGADRCEEIYRKIKDG
ncbi:MAG: hypothetical protein J5940_07395 [Clostridia bacterium]|nr:hypothetical protein [Clostridia bacterium]